MYRLFHLLIPAPFLAVCFVMLALNSILGNAKPETIDRQTLTRVIQLRDFRLFSPDLLERLTHRCEQEFGRHSPNRPIFELPNWEKKIHTYYQSNRTSRQSYLENNLTLMAKTRYFQWMYESQSATPDQKAVLMKEVLADMIYWEGVYFDYLRFLDQPLPTQVELIQDFQRMIKSFKEGASPEEAALVDSFAKDISRAMILRRIWTGANR